MEIKLVIIGLTSAIILVSALLLYREFANLHSQVNGLAQRVSKLEDANRTRMPYQSYDEVLNAMAALDALEHDMQFRQDVVQNAKAHLIKSMTVGTKREEGIKK